MARIRSIKPDFFTSDDVVKLTPLARLLYIGTWCEADCEGRLVWTPSALKRRYLPTDDCDIAAICRELVAGGLVVLYGDGLAYIPTFKDHQVINPRETKSRLPEPPPARVSDASLRVSDAPSLPSLPSLPPAGRSDGRRGIPTLIQKRDLTAAAEGQALTIPQAWTNKITERSNRRWTHERLRPFYAYAQQVAADSKPDLSGRYAIFDWLDARFEEWREQQEAEAQIQAGRETVRQLRQMEADFRAKQAGGAA